MAERRFLAVALVVAVIVVAVLAVTYGPKIAGDSAVRARYCNASGTAVMVYRCDNSTYLVKPILPDIGSTYVDSGANPIAVCGGFINVHPPECPGLEALSCDRTSDLCQ